MGSKKGRSEKGDAARWRRLSQPFSESNVKSKTRAAVPTEHSQIRHHIAQFGHRFAQPCALPETLIGPFENGVRRETRKMVIVFESHCQILRYDNIRR